MSNLAFVMAHGIEPVKYSANVSITPVADGGYNVEYIPPDGCISLAPPEYVYTLEAAVTLAKQLEYSLRIYNQQVEQSIQQGRRKPRSYGRKFYQAI